jgi:transposase
MMKYNERLGIKHVCFVMDRGFYTEENIKSMAFEHPFLVGIPNHLAIAKEMITQYGKKVMSSRYDIGLTGAMGIGIPDQRYDFRSNIYLFYSTDKIADEQRLFKAKLSAWEEELKEGKLVKQAEAYFQVEDMAERNSVKVTRNHDAIDEKINNLGYFLMMGTDLNKSPQEVLEIYRRKDVIEKSFDELKNDLDLKRLRVHSEVAMDGKLFLSFIGLILRTFVHNTLKTYLDSHRPFSMAQIFDELRMIKVVKTKDGLSLCNPLTKRQRTILEQFHKTEEDLKATIERYSGPKSFFDC